MERLEGVSLRFVLDDVGPLPVKRGDSHRSLLLRIASVNTEDRRREVMTAIARSCGKLDEDAS